MLYVVSERTEDSIVLIQRLTYYRTLPSIHDGGKGQGLKTNSSLVERSSQDETIMCLKLLKSTEFTLKWMCHERYLCLNNYIVVIQ